MEDRKKCSRCKKQYTPEQGYTKKTCPSCVAGQAAHRAEKLKDVVYCTLCHYTAEPNSTYCKRHNDTADAIENGVKCSGCKKELYTS